MRRIESVDTDIEVWAIPTKTAKSVLKPILASLVMVFISHCGSDHAVLEGHAFEPSNIALIEQTLAHDFYPQADFSKISFYAIAIKDAVNDCDSQIGICSGIEENKIVFPEGENQNYCPYIFHELMHFLLNQKYHDSDPNHNRKEWNQDETSNTWFVNRCIEIGALPMSIFYQPTGLQ